MGQRRATVRKDFCFIDRADAGRQIAEKIKEKKI